MFALLHKNFDGPIQKSSISFEKLHFNDILMNLFALWYKNFDGPIQKSSISFEKLLSNNNLMIF
jgi:hypothetical protein